MTLGANVVITQLKINLRKCTIPSALDALNNGYCLGNCILQQNCLWDQPNISCLHDKLRMMVPDTILGPQFSM
jgi:hypothetical protein